MDGISMNLMKKKLLKRYNKKSKKKNNKMTTKQDWWVGSALLALTLKILLESTYVMSAKHLHLLRPNHKKSIKLLKPLISRQLKKNLKAKSRKDLKKLKYKFYNFSIVSTKRSLKRKKPNLKMAKKIRKRKKKRKDCKTLRNLKSSFKQVHPYSKSHRLNHSLSRDLNYSLKL